MQATVAARSANVAAQVLPHETRPRAPPRPAVLADELPPLLDREIFFGDPQGLRPTLPPREVEYLVARDEGHGFAGELNTLATYAKVEEFLGRHLGGPYCCDAATLEKTRRLSNSRIFALAPRRDMTQPATFSVLMVDDNAAMREAIARSLTRRGCQVTTAADGVEGLEVLRRRPVDVVITDLNMPERGGLWLWRHALALRPELRGRFVLIASEPLPEPLSMSLFMESERFLLKPLSLETLWRQVQEVMQSVRSAHKVYSGTLPRAPESPASSAGSAP